MSASLSSVSATRLAFTVGTRIAPGAVFVIFGADEFVNHARNVRSFTLYGLPSPSAFSYAIGSLEISGGLALLWGVALLPVAIALAGDMVGAIVVSGIALGELVSLTLAPAMLVAMLALIARELRGRSGSNTSTSLRRLGPPRHPNDEKEMPHGHSRSTRVT
jgi:putative oxidoreductase